MESPTFDPDNGIYKVTPQPKAPAPPEDAIPLPVARKGQAQASAQAVQSKVQGLRQSRHPRQTTRSNYGKGGRLKNLVGDQQLQSRTRTPPPASSVPGQGGGDFATRFGWYIQAAKRRVDPNWDRLSIDSSVRNSTALHCAVSFSVNRDGSIKNVRITQSSGNLSWDNAGLRAIMSSNPLPPLPARLSRFRSCRNFRFSRAA